MKNNIYCNKEIRKVRNATIYRVERYREGEIKYHYEVWLNDYDVIYISESYSDCLCYAQKYTMMSPYDFVYTYYNESNGIEDFYHDTIKDIKTLHRLELFSDYESMEAIEVVAKRTCKYIYRKIKEDNYI